MSWFYNHNYLKFASYFKSKYNKPEDYISDLFIESYEALWNNINNGRLTEDKLTTSLYQYMLGIAINMLKAGDRKTKELFKVNMFFKAADSVDESLDTRVQAKIQYEAEHAEDDEKQLEMEDFVDRAVSEMPPPCNEILRYFYWNKLSGNEIAEIMNYSNADSVKTQKNKCMNKLKPLVQRFRNL